MATTFGVGGSDTNTNLTQNTDVTTTGATTNANSVLNNTATNTTNTTDNTTNNTGSTANQQAAASTSGTQSSQTGSQTSGVNVLANTTAVTSASPTAIAAETGLLNTTTGDATNSATQTDQLVNNILTKAAITFAPNLSANPSSGGYNATSTGLLQGNAEAMATSDAAQAALTYQTTEQGLAQQAASGLIGATTTTQGSSTQSTISNIINSLLSAGTSGTSNVTAGTTNTANAGSSNTISNLLSSVVNNIAQSGSTASTQNQAGTVVQNQNTQQASGGLGTVICTYLLSTGEISRNGWNGDMREFMRYPACHRAAYHKWAVPFVSFMRTHPQHRLTKLVAKVFVARNKKKRWARALVASWTTLVGITSPHCWYVLLEQDLKLFMPRRRSY